MINRVHQCFLAKLERPWIKRCHGMTQQTSRPDSPRFFCSSGDPFSSVRIGEGAAGQLRPISLRPRCLRGVPRLRPRGGPPLHGSKGKEKYALFSFCFPRHQWSYPSLRETVSRYIPEGVREREGETRANDDSPNNVSTTAPSLVLVIFQRPHFFYV